MKHILALHLSLALLLPVLCACNTGNTTTDFLHVETMDNENFEVESYKAAETGSGADSVSAAAITVRTLVEPTMEYRAIFKFQEGLAPVIGTPDFIDYRDYYTSTSGSYLGYIDKNGKIVIPIESFYEYWAFQDGGKPAYSSEGLVRVRDRNDKWGFSNQAGALVIPREYDGAGDFSEGLATVRKNGKAGYIDKTGRVVTPLEYESYVTGDFSEGLAAVRKNGETGYIDKNGNTIIPLEYEAARSFSDGLAAVQKSGKWGYIDKTGKVVIPFEYDEVGNFSEGLASVGKNNYMGFIDKTGKLVIPFTYHMYFYFDAHADIYFLPDFSNGLAAVSSGTPQLGNTEGGWGFIDKAGNVVVPFEYDGESKFSEGLALVVKNRKHGYIDKTGKVVVPLEYDSGNPFREGLAAVQKNGRWGILQIDGFWSN